MRIFVHTLSRSLVLACLCGAMIGENKKVSGRKAQIIVFNFKSKSCFRFASNIRCVVGVFGTGVGAGKSRQSASRRRD